MSEKRECKIVQDLLPNYIDKLTSEESNQYISEHINTCTECKKVLSDMQEDIKVNNKENDKRKIDYMKKVKNKLGIIHIVKTAILTTLCLFLITVVGYSVYLFSDGIVDKSNPMTREEVIALLEEGAKNTNYYYREVSLFDIDVNGEIFVKDGKMLSTTNSHPFLWRDEVLKEQILFASSETSGTSEYQMIDKAMISKIDNEDYTVNTLISLAYGTDDYERYDFKYVGEKTIDDEAYIVIKLYSKLEENTIYRKLFCTKLYISKEDKVVQIMESVVPDKVFLEKVKLKYNVKLNCVTDEEVERPNLDRYEIIDWTEIQEQGSDE